MTDTVDETVDFERQQCAYFLAALLSSNALDVSAVCATVRPDDIALLDDPTATIYRVAVGLARRGVTPDHTQVWAKLLQDGEFAGRKGELVRDRMLAVVSVRAYAERLFETAAQLLSLVFRNRLAAAGAAIAQAAVDFSEADAWALMIREGGETRKIYERIERLRGEAA
ncbi:hypothetical protein [Williamsia sp. DF01-3]|uniref:hypothetical protein n=1 Tax=Williamsia sp. DF01-3 TaxID=2934157 RepID=UPI001FF2020B|nr:hypothetical protein [Williamsia sp. DF01-3]MCK0516971.1 hypothetical protein [Williamsia sp. DF01-3]